MPEVEIDLHYTLTLRREMDEAELQSLTDAIEMAIEKRAAKHVTAIKESASYTVDGVPLMAIPPRTHRVA